MIRFVVNNYYNFKNRHDVRILDLGCGAGGNIWYLSREGFDSFGVDGSPSSVTRTLEKLKNENLSADIQVSDFSCLPYEDKFFDCVIDAASIQHNDEATTHKIISEIYRVLKNGGKFFGMMLQSDKDMSEKEFYTHYTGDEHVYEIFNKFKDIELNFNTYTENNRDNYIKFNLVSAKKN